MQIDIDMDSLLPALFENKIVYHQIGDNTIQVVNTKLVWNVEEDQKVVNVAQCSKYLDNHKLTDIEINLSKTENIHISLLGVLIQVKQQMLKNKNLKMKLILSPYADNLFNLLDVKHHFKQEIICCI